MSVNKAILVGRLGADPELRRLPTGRPVCEFRVATNHSKKGADGEYVDSTDWHRVVVWGNQAEPCKTYLAKGCEVFVEGRIHGRSWNDREGQKRFSTEIIAERVQFLGKSGARSADAVEKKGDEDADGAADSLAA